MGGLLTMPVTGPLKIKPGEEKRHQFEYVREGHSHDKREAHHQRRLPDHMHQIHFFTFIKVLPSGVPEHSAHAAKHAERRSPHRRRCDSPESAHGNPTYDARTASYA
jgi:hypothetical protein